MHAQHLRLQASLQASGVPMMRADLIYTSRVGQNHIYIYIYIYIYIRYSLQGFHLIYGHIRCIYTVIYGVYIRFWPTLHMKRLCCYNAAIRTLFDDNMTRGVLFSDIQLVSER